MAEKPTVESSSETVLYRMMLLLTINLLVAVVAPFFVTVTGTFWDYVIAFVAAFIVISLFDRSYGRRVVRTVIFVAYVLWQIVVSNIGLAWVVLRPRPNLNPGIVGVPLTVQTELEITTLASVITLTPGTLSVDLIPDEEGRQVLYVHGLQVGDEELFRSSIQNGFERLILQISRGE